MTPPAEARRRWQCAHHSTTAGNTDGLFTIIPLQAKSPRLWQISRRLRHPTRSPFCHRSGWFARYSHRPINVAEAGDNNDPSVNDVSVTVSEGIAAGTSITDLSDTSGDTDADGALTTPSLLEIQTVSFPSIPPGRNHPRLWQISRLRHCDIPLYHHFATEADVQLDTATVTINVAEAGDNNDPSVNDVRVTVSEGIAAGTSITDLRTPPAEIRRRWQCAHLLHHCWKYRRSLYHQFRHRRNYPSLWQISRLRHCDIPLAHHFRHRSRWSGLGYSHCHHQRH